MLKKYLLKNFINLFKFTKSDDSLDLDFNLDILLKNFSENNLDTLNENDFDNLNENENTDSENLIKKNKNKKILENNNKSSFYFNLINLLIITFILVSIYLLIPFYLQVDNTSFVLELFNDILDKNIIILEKIEKLTKLLNELSENNISNKILKDDMERCIDINMKNLFKKMFSNQNLSRIFTNQDYQNKTLSTILKIINKKDDNE